MSKASIRTLRRDRIEDESSMFRLSQVGLFRSNKAGVDELAKICEILLFKIFGADVTRIALEMNFKGDYFVEKLSSHYDFYEEIFLYTKHNIKTNKFSLGIKLGPHNKMFFCREFRRLVLEKRIVLNEENTFDEMNDFGVNSRGSYSSQSGHDDIAMTCVNLVPFLSSDSFTTMVEEVHDYVPSEIKDSMNKKLSEIDSKDNNETLSYLKDLL